MASLARTIELLNELLALHRYSLPMYLSDAKPWSNGRDEKVVEALRRIADDHKRMSDSIGSLILELNGEIYPGEFSMRFTDMHDLSTEHILKEVRHLLEADIARMEKIAEELVDQPKAYAIVKEAIGAAKGHLQNLDELMPSLSTQ